MSTGIAATALAAMPVLAAVPEPDPDAELIAACEDWHDSNRCCNEAFEAAALASDECKGKEPPIPAALYEELELRQNNRRGPGGGRPWDPRDLKIWADTGSSLHADSTESHGVLTTFTAWLPIPETTRVRAAKLLAIHERHALAKRRVWAKYERVQKAANRLASENWDRVGKICEIPAQSIAGVYAKMKVLNECGMFDDGSEDMQPAAQSLLKDLARLAAVRT